MVVGTSFFGDVQTVNGQGITTKFFMIGLPLFPLETMFVVQDGGNEKRGFSMDFHTESVALGYGRIISWALGATMLLLGLVLRRELGSLIIPGAIFLALSVFFQFFLGKPKKGDAAKRLFLGQALGVNAFPHWLPYNVAKGFYADLERRYALVQHEYNGLTWQQCIKTGQKAKPGHFAIFFALSTYQEYFLPGAESQEMTYTVWLMA
ncbi:MAG TPA: hypothetical protein VK826_08935 [Bacteroidia bacterium]|nr:hypothetical protein [Bacteroidia bacterium]